MTHTEELIAIGGCRVRVMQGGDGPPMVFLHGSGGARAWTPFMQALAERFHLIVPEHPGFGGSDTPTWLTGVSDLAYFYLDFLEAQGLENLHLVGNSLGGWIAAEIAMRDSSRLRTLGLIAPAGLQDRDNPPADIFAWTPSEFAHNLFVDPSFVAGYEKQVSESDARLLEKNNATLEVIARSPLLCNPQLEPWLHRIKRPTLILWGDGDKVLPVGQASRFKSAIPDARVSVISNCGHLPHVEQRGVVVNTILDFIASC